MGAGMVPGVTTVHPSPAGAGHCVHLRSLIAQGPFPALAQSEQRKRLVRDQSFPLLVAGARIERASGGYEPPEVPLLYPAIQILYSFEKNPATKAL